MSKLSLYQDVTPEGYHRIKVAFWLCTFLGGFAAHRYYLHIKDGFFYKLLWHITGGFFSLGIIADWFVLLKQWIKCAKYKKAHPEQFR